MGEGNKNVKIGQITDIVWIQKIKFLEDSYSSDFIFIYKGSTKKVGWKDRRVRTGKQNK